MARPRRQREPAAAGRTADRLRESLARVEVGELIRDSIAVWVRHLARAGFGPDEIAQYVGDHVDRWVDEFCERSDRTLVRRCGDNVGNVAEVVAENLIRKHLPQ